MKPGVGSIIEQKTYINRSGDESEQWPNSGAWNRFRNSSRLTPRFTTTPTWLVT